MNSLPLFVADCPENALHVQSCSQVSVTKRCNILRLQHSADSSLYGITLSHEVRLSREKTETTHVIPAKEHTKCSLSLVNSNNT